MLTCHAECFVVPACLAGDSARSAEEIDSSSVISQQQVNIDIIFVNWN